MNGREIKKLCPKMALAIPEVAFRNFKVRSFPIGPSVCALFILKPVMRYFEVE